MSNIINDVLIIIWWICTFDRICVHYDVTHVRFVLFYLYRFYVKDAEGKQTMTPLYEAWFYWQTDKYRMPDIVKE